MRAERTIRSRLLLPYPGVPTVPSLRFLLCMRVNMLVNMRVNMHVNMRVNMRVNIVTFTVTLTHCGNSRKPKTPLDAVAFSLSEHGYIRGMPRLGESHVDKRESLVGCIVNSSMVSSFRRQRCSALLNLHRHFLERI